MNNKFTMKKRDVAGFGVECAFSCLKCLGLVTSVWRFIVEFEIQN